MSCEVNPEVKKIIRAMARNRVEAGVTDPIDLVDTIHEEIHGHVQVDGRSVWKSEIADIISGYGETRKPTQDEIVLRMRAIKAELKADAERVSGKVSVERSVDEKIAARAKALQSQIEDLERRIRTGDTSKPQREGVTSPKIESLKAERDALKAKLDALTPKATRATPDEAKNKTRVTNLRKQLDTLQRQLDTGDFSKPERAKPVYDENARALEAQRDALRKQVDEALRKIARQNRSTAVKVTDFALAFRRAVILSSIHTIAKLTSAATLRNVSTPIEEAIGGVLSVVPGLRGVSAMAEREGGFSMRAELAAAKATFSRATLDEMWKTATEGMGTADALYGTHERAKYKWLDWVGQIHGALKTPAKRNEFFRAAEKIGEHMRRKMISEGKSPGEVDRIMSDDATQAVIGAKAYLHAQRAILMQDNFAVDGYKVMSRWLQHAGKDGSVERAAGTATAKVLEYLLPIVKIPTNFVFEATDYAVGGPKAALQLAMSKGLKNLTPEQADYVMRNLKKQTVGAALLTAGYLMADSVGGYYQPGKKQDDGKPEHGGVQVFGVNIPKYLVHNPALELLQMGATIRQIEAEHGKGKGSIGAGVYEGVTSLLSEVPFFDQPMRVARGLKNAESAAAYAGENVRDAILPPDLQHYAKDSDPQQTRSRRPAGFTDAIKLGIPGLREQVGQEDVKHLSLQERLDAYAEMTPQQRSDENMIKRIKDSARRHRKDMTPEQRDQIRAILDSQ